MQREGPYSEGRAAEGQGPYNTARVGTVQQGSMSEGPRVRTHQSPTKPNPTPPAFFLHGDGDELIPPWHTQDLFLQYPSTSKIGIKFDGSHNSPRPAIVYSLLALFITGILKRPTYNPNLVISLI